MTDRLVIDCNEDGFTEANVNAICAVGQSTKANSGGYIGGKISPPSRVCKFILTKACIEKGIGFKSVFKVARAAKVQSGPFSFNFNSGDSDGLGMVTPYQSTYESLPPPVRTRLTLTLLDQNDFSKRRQDLISLPETLLLFLHKVSVCVYCPISHQSLRAYRPVMTCTTAYLFPSITLDYPISSLYKLAKHFHNTDSVNCYSCKSSRSR